MINILQFIQHNQIVYCIFSAFIAWVIEIAICFFEKRLNKNEKDTKKKKNILRYFIIFVSLLLLRFLDVFFPFLPKTEEKTTDGFLKLVFFDAKFAYYDYEGQAHYDENDIYSPRECAYLAESIAPPVYITIQDVDGNVVYDEKSEHMENCLIDLGYGEYKLTASTMYYEKYTVDLVLTPENKKNNVWCHKVYFIPDSVRVRGIKVQVMDINNCSYSNMEAEIGFPGMMLQETLDENGYFQSSFSLSKGEYIVGLEDINLFGRFVINELTQDNQIIQMKLEESN